MTIDSHHHFWKYSPEEYGWIGEGMETLKRDFGPADLAPLAQKAGVEGVISVQARTKVEETDALLALAKEHPLIKGVVGWVDLTGAGVGEQLERFAGEPLVRGFRHVLQSEPDERYMLREDFNRGVAQLHQYGYVYDILIYHTHLKHVPAFVDQHPGQVFVIDHLAKPKIDSHGPDADWVRDLTEAARRENVFCKLSGMVTEVVPGVQWSPELLQPYFDAALKAFGAGRLLFGSDWPVCLLKADYATWIQTVRSWISRLSADEQAAIMGGNAWRAYGLESATA